MRSYILVIFAALTTFLVGCGGGSSEKSRSSSSLSSALSSSNSTLSSTPSSLSNSTASSQKSSSSSSVISIGTAGIFDVNYGQFTGVYTLLEDGRFYGIHYVGGSTLAGHPHGILSPENSTSNIESITWANFIDDANKVGKYEANPKFGRSFTSNSVSFKISGGFGAFTAQTTKQKKYGNNGSKSLYHDPIPLMTFAGSYKGIVRTAGIMKPTSTPSEFVMDAEGNFTATAMDCTFNGTLTQHEETGVFDVTVGVSGSICRLSSELRGIATPLSLINDKPAIAIQLNHTSNTETAVFIVTKQ